MCDECRTEARTNRLAPRAFSFETQPSQLLCVTRAPCTTAMRSNHDVLLKLDRQWRPRMTLSSRLSRVSAAVALSLSALPLIVPNAQAQNRPNVVMLMTDDTGWNDFGVYGGGANLGHPTPNIDRVGQEGAVFTSWYGQASCTAGRASFMTGRIPIRSALSVVVVPGDENGLTKSTPTIAEFFQKYVP
ncbi:MAG: sulfatase-like hydrolase/transferase [Acetobacteraceae bacterium]